ncbi:hypothetical protein bcgnr5390_11620 [Bacillus luti]|nr:hypothetical protein BC2903_29290 [Bacillus cereus]
MNMNQFSNEETTLVVKQYVKKLDIFLFSDQKIFKLDRDTLLSSLIEHIEGLIMGKLADSGLEDMYSLYSIEKNLGSIKYEEILDAFKDYNSDVEFERVENEREEKHKEVQDAFKNYEENVESKRKESEKNQ